MRNLKLSQVEFQGDETNATFQGCEAFEEDHATGLLYVASKDKVAVWNIEMKQNERCIDWSVERGDSSLIDLQFMFDTNELAAVLSNGTVLLVNLDSDTISEAAFTGSQCLAAAWNADLTVLACTDGAVLTFYDRMFEPFEQRELCTVEKGKDELVTVGWGSRETQFQGSAGKAAREKKVELSRTAYPDDTRQPSIEWRADAQYVFVSYYEETSEERKVSVFNRDGDLMSSLKNESSMEENFAVRAVGNYIATTHITEDNTRQMIFFERNGEKRHDMLMTSRGDWRVVGMAWDTEAAALAVVLRGEDKDRVELWTVSNYDWTRKWSLDIPSRVACWKWSSEKARTLSIATVAGSFACLHFELEYCAPAAIAVVQATDEFRITDVAKCPIPPPMCQYSIPLEEGAVHCFSFDSIHLVVLDVSWNLYLFSSKIDSRRLSPLRSLQLTRQPDWMVASSLSCAPDGSLALLVVNGSELISIDTTTGELRNIGSTPCASSIVWTAAKSSGQFHVATCQGIFYQWTEQEQFSRMFTVAESPAYRVKYSQDDRPVVLSTGSSELFLEGRQMANAVTSFLISDDVCLYITLHNKLHIVSLRDEDSFKAVDSERCVELGSRLVCCAPEGTSLTMQMPRGNLETIHPRRFIVRVLRQLIERKQYVAALRQMKKHRINMNLLVDHRPEEFLSNADLLLGDDSDADLVNLLVASLTDERSEWCQNEVTENKVSRVTSLLCASVLALPLSDRLRFFTVFLSSVLKMSPPNVEEALQQIKKHTDEMSPADRDSYSRQWLHHVNFFIDEKSIFNAALATYDLRLTVQVAEATNRDPKEYLPLLNELRKVEPEVYRAYRIDMVREDWVGALRHLAKLDKKFEEALDLVAKRNLYSHALRIYKGNTRYQDICRTVAAHLETKADWKEAAMLYGKALDHQKMLRCLEMSRDVTAYLAAVGRLNSASDDVIISDDVIRSTLLKMAIQLKSSGKWLEAAEALTHTNASHSEVLDAYCKAHAWSQCMNHLAVSNVESESKDYSFVREAAVDRASRLLDEVASRTVVIAAHAKRLEAVRDLKEKRIANMKEGVETGRDIEDCDAFSDVASTASMLSRRTSKSGSSRASTTATIRRRKQIDRKKQSLKEGGEYEDSALLLALHEQYKWLQTLVAELHPLLRCLVELDELEIASRLQLATTGLLADTLARRGQIWPTRLHPKHLCGPLHAIYSIDDVFSFPEDGGMPAVIVIEQEMIAPPALTDVTWKLKVLEA